MPRGDSQERQSRPFRSAPVLLPIAERVDADTDGLSKLRLRKTNECSQSSNIATRLELATDESASYPGRNRPRELLVCQLGDVRHDFCSKYEW